ncbi:hypothetical protein CEXT_124491 [Caerostris extrusa]|uniref:Uncharacterized protein n=1 Tax=Caerostris extrusa TaxID=172846 RepID=A0AAV4NC49_CAEEX|nr:hypothetical protein CEXT_124491 [Caerostris extrusa]
MWVEHPSVCRALNNCHCKTDELIRSSEGRQLARNQNHHEKEGLPWPPLEIDIGLFDGIAILNEYNYGQHL